MLVPMAKVNVVGHRRSLDRTLEILHRIRRVQVINVVDDDGVQLPPLTIDDEHMSRLEDLRYLRARLDGLLRLLPELPEPPAESDAEELDPGLLRDEIDRIGPELEGLLSRLETLKSETETLPRHLESLERLLPLLPDARRLEGYETTALLVEARHAAVLGDLNARLDSMLEGNFEMISNGLDTRTVGAVIIYPKQASSAVHELLGHEQVSRVRLPTQYEALPLRQALAAMERRLLELPTLIETTENEVTDFVRSHPHWVEARTEVSARIERLSAISSLGATSHTFVLSGWVPEGELDHLRDTLVEEVGPDVLLQEAEVGESDEPPVLLRNPEAARPYESLVGLLEVPRYGTLDPSVLMLVFLPLFFGMMLGDVVYGLVVMIGAVVFRRYTKAGGMLNDLSRVLVLSGAWSMVFGVVYGEYLGDLGFRLFGVEPIWINRETAVETLLLFALAVGAAHVVLGLILGAWQALQSKNRRKLGERTGMLVALAGLFVIVGAAAGALPDQLVTPSIAAVIVGMAIVVASGGMMGLLMGPLDMMGTLGNILSYLRIAAIGIASVYLARVANDLGFGAPVWIGLIVAALFHALNLVLGVFSPTIQALRLHYVEFFGKFYEGGGKAFHPFGAEGASRSQRKSQR